MLIQIRLRGAPNGQTRLEVDDEANLGTLIRLIKEKTELVDFSLKYGYPPKTLDIGLDAQESPIKNHGLRGETLIIVPIEAPEPVAIPQTTPLPVTSSPEAAAKPDGSELSVAWPERGGHIALTVLRVMPDDNSCLFTAVGGAFGIANASEVLRGQVFDYILEHTDKYDKAILGDEPMRYASRMQDKQTWGGAIELSILSDIYQVEICSIDVKSLRVDKFGECMDQRIIILYSGIHYDRIAFAMDINYPVEVDETRWATTDDGVLMKALELAERLQQAHYYTDTTDFVIKCEICNWIGQGTKQAAQHEKETSHSQFGEMKID